MDKQQFETRSDRGMSLSEWQDWIVDLLIKKYDAGCSHNQIRFIFAAEFDRRYNSKAISEQLTKGNGK